MTLKEKLLRILRRDKGMYVVKRMPVCLEKRTVRRFSPVQEAGVNMGADGDLGALGGRPNMWLEELVG